MICHGSGMSRRRCASGEPQMPLRMLHVLALAAIGGCASTPAAPDRSPAEARPAMAMASGVTIADRDAGLDRPRVVPLHEMTGDVEVVYGDPEVAGQAFVMRIRELPGTVVPPHSHPVDEHITVLTGTWYFGFGERFDPAALRELKTGTYAFAPKGSWMFGYSPDGAVVQVHGIGPFSIHWHDGAKTLDDPDAQATFHFRRGDNVASARGAGRIVEGYASGTLVQYEIEKPNGERFMEHEHALRAR
jgi:quercetin dioxygenase-like cupin family protein